MFTNRKFNTRIGKVYWGLVPFPSSSSFSFLLSICTYSFCEILVRSFMCLIRKCYKLWLIGQINEETWMIYALNGIDWIDFGATLQKRSAYEITAINKIIPRNRICVSCVCVFFLWTVKWIAYKNNLFFFCHPNYCEISIENAHFHCKSFEISNFELNDSLNYCCLFYLICNRTQFHILNWMIH